MPVLSIDKRRFITLLGAASLSARPARAVELDVGHGASRLSRSLTDLGPPDTLRYTPPASLKTVADLYKRMTVAVSVAGQGPFAFVVDTGANQSVISRTLADRLALAPGPVEPLNGVAGVQLTETVATDLRIGDRRTRAVTLSVLPDEAIGAEGMLGLDQLAEQSLTLDFRKHELRIQESGMLWRDPDDVALRAHRRNGQLTLVDVDIAGIPVTAFLDSGAQDTIGNMALKELALIRAPKTLWGDVRVLSVTGQTITAEMADLPALRVGGMHVPDWPVAFADLHTFELWGLVRQPAILLGVDVLSRFEYVALDFGRDEVRFHLPEQT